jgi:hypothetical protein
MLAHEDPLQIIPAADVHIVVFDADEIEVLTLPREDARGRHRKSVFSRPDLPTDLCGSQTAFFGEFSS